jgi:hypothetical protein
VLERRGNREGSRGVTCDVEAASLRRQESNGEDHRSATPEPVTVEEFDRFVEGKADATLFELVDGAPSP